MHSLFIPPASIISAGISRVMRISRVSASVPLLSRGMHYPGDLKDIREIIGSSV